MKKTAALFLILTFGLVTGDAQATVWKQDPAHSQVKFGVTHLVISEVDGNFKDFDVTLKQLNPDFSGSTLEASIKTASISTDNDFRDKHLRSDDFLNAEKYPAITFKSTSFEKTGDNAYKITGDLTIRDVTKPVVLDAKFLGEMTDGRGTTRAGFKATGSINRFDYGVKWNKAVETGGLVVSDKVDITLLMELQKQK
jgi:polyisoprenoid-binding protein YceI